MSEAFKNLKRDLQQRYERLKEPQWEGVMVPELTPIAYTLALLEVVMELSERVKVLEDLQKYRGEF